MGSCAISERPVSAARTSQTRAVQSFPLVTRWRPSPRAATCVIPSVCPGSAATGALRPLLCSNRLRAACSNVRAVLRICGAGGLSAGYLCQMLLDWVADTTTDRLR